MLCVTLLFGTNTWAQDYYNVTRYSQDFEDAQTYNEGWSGNATRSQFTLGENKVMHIDQGGGSGNRSANLSLAAVSDYFATVTDYSFEFDFGQAYSNQNASTTDIITTDDVVLFTILDDRTGTSHIKVGDTEIGSFSNNGYAKACPTTLYHFLIKSSSDGTTLTVTNASNSTIMEEKNLSDNLVNLKAINNTLGRAVSHMAFDNLILKEHRDQEAVSAPTASITGVIGASRVITIVGGTSSKENEVKTYFTTDDSTPTAESDEYSEPITIDEDCNVKIISISSTNVLSDVTTFSVTTGEITLNMPTWAKNGYENGESTVILTSNQSDILCSPAAKIVWSTDSGNGEVESGESIIVKDGETMTLYSTADGYTDSEVVTVDAKAYVGASDWTESYANTGDAAITLDTEVAVNVNGTDFYKMIANEQTISNNLFTANQNINAYFLFRKGGIYGGNPHTYAIDNLKAGQYIIIEGTGAGEGFNLAAGANLESDKWNTKTGVAYEKATFSFYVKEDGPITFSLNRYNYINSITVKLSREESAIYTIEFVDEDDKVLYREENAAKIGTKGSKTFSKYMKFAENWYEYSEDNYIKEFNAADGANYQVKFNTAPKVVGFVEAENCKGNNSPTLSDQDKKYSGGYAAGLAGENKRDRGTIIATLPAGAYEFHALLTEEVKRAVCLRNANLEYADNPIVSISGNPGEQSKVFVLKEETQLRVTGQNIEAEKSHITEKFDYCYITNGIDYFDIADIAENNAKSTEENPNDGILTNSLLGVEGTTLEVTNDKENAGAIWEDTWQEEVDGEMVDKSFVDLRIQEDGSFTLATSSSSLALNKIVFTGAALNMSTAYGKFEEPAASRAHKAAPKMVTKTWTGNNDKVKFWADKTVRISTITVYLEPTDGNTETYEEKPRPEKPADKPALEVAANIAAFKALADSTEAKLTLTDAVVTFVNGKNIYLEDATGAIVLYDMGLELTEGQKLNGLLAGKTVNYFALPEMVKTDSTKTDTFTAEAGEVKATTMALADICKVENLARLITISNVTIDVVDNNIFATSGDEKLQVYNKFKVDGLDLQKGNVYTSITGILVPWQNKETLEITYELAPRTLADLVLDADATGISELAGEKAAREVYNLNGQRVNATKKGLYIINGKKVMVK